MQDILDSSPKDLEPYEGAKHIEERHDDLNFWQMGIYVREAVAVAIDNCFNGDKSSAKYYEKPVFNMLEDESKLTEEEKELREIRKMIRYEEQFASIYRQNHPDEES